MEEGVDDVALVREKIEGDEAQHSLAWIATLDKP